MPGFLRGRVTRCTLTLFGLKWCCCTVNGNRPKAYYRPTNGRALWFHFEVDPVQWDSFTSYDTSQLRSITTDMGY